MKSKASKLPNFFPCFCIFLAITAFVLAVFLVETRQEIVCSGRKILEFEKKISAYAMKNTELDARILKLSSSESLRAVIVNDGLVMADARSVIKIPRVETAMYVSNRANGKSAHRFSSKNSQIQTNLTANN